MGHHSPMSGRVFGYTFGRVPTWLLDEAVSDRSIRLFALLTRYADREGRGFPGRRTLAERLRCSVDSIDRALRELVHAGAVRVEERWDVDGDGGRLTNDYHLLEHREEDPDRTVAAPPGRRDAAAPGRAGAAGPRRAGAACPAARERPLREREPEEREPGVNETPPSIPPPERRREIVSYVKTPPRSTDLVTAVGDVHREAVGQDPERPATWTARFARRGQRAHGRSFDRAESHLRAGSSMNPVDARILASLRRSEAERG
jgi:hypothetical protein